jgi:hypothetical protein
VNLRLSISIFLLVFTLAACSDTRNANTELSGLNYTNSWITAFSVDGYYGHGIEPNGGGGAFVCCVTIPTKWHKDMKVTVRWAEDERIPSSWKERIVDVPKYTEHDIGAFLVHFYPRDIVKVLVTTKSVGHPDYPYPRPK